MRNARARLPWLPLAAWSASVVASCGIGAQASPGAPRAVVLIVVDTLRRDHLGCYGYERDTSPNLDRFAAESVRFERAISQAPWTTPSIGAILSSRYPTALGIHGERSILDDDVELLAERLREAGYATGAVVSHSFCSSEWGFDQGFDSFDESQVGVGLSSPEVTERALAFLDGQGERPFFLWVHYFDPHWAYQEHPGFTFDAGGEYTGPITSNMDMREVKRLQPDLDERDVAELARHYDSEIALTDHHIGRLLDRLREADLYDETLIVFVADHGEEFRERGAFGHSGSLQQEVIGVPLVIHFPGEQPGVVRAPVASIDIYPTVLERLGIEAPEGLEGTALDPLREPSHPVFSETERGATLRSVVLGDLKLIRDVRNGGNRLYDLASDPLERRDLLVPDEAPRLHELLRERRSEVERLTSALDGWLARLALQERHARQVEVSPEEEQRLRSIGYGGD